MSTSINQGLVNDKPSSRVLRPPGGGSSNIFGTSDDDGAQQNRGRQQRPQDNSKNNIFGGSGEAQTRAAKMCKPRDNNIFGSVEEPAKKDKENTAEKAEDKSVKSCSVRKENVTAGSKGNHSNNNKRGSKVLPQGYAKGVSTSSSGVYVGRHQFACWDSKSDSRGMFKSPITQELAEGVVEVSSPPPTPRHAPGDYFKNPITGQVHDDVKIVRPPGRQHIVRDFYKNVITGELANGVKVAPPKTSKIPSKASQGMFKNCITAEFNPGSEHIIYVKRQKQAAPSQETFKNPITGELRDGLEFQTRPQKSNTGLSGKYKNVFTHELQDGSLDYQPRPHSASLAWDQGSFKNVITGEVKEGKRVPNQHRNSVTLVAQHPGVYKNCITGELKDGVEPPEKNEIKTSVRPSRDMVDPINGVFAEGHVETKEKRQLAGAPYGKGLYLNPIIWKFRPECEPPPKTPKTPRGLKCPITGKKYDDTYLPTASQKRAKSAATVAPKGMKNILTGEKYGDCHATESAPISRSGFNPITGEAYETQTQRPSTKVRQPPGGASSVTF